jgi:hypothetical protein
VQDQRLQEQQFDNIDQRRQADGLCMQFRSVSQPSRATQEQEPKCLISCLLEYNSFSAKRLTAVPGDTTAASARSSA